MEIWKDITGYDGKYQVSNCGRVRRFYKHTPPHISKAHPNHGGYLYVILCRDNKSKTCTIHRLVAQAFINNPNNKPEVNHINGIKTDNRAENLEWCTRSENTRHALVTGLMKQGEKHYNAKLTAAQVVYIRENPDKLTGVELAEMFGVTATTIGYVQLGKSYRNAGGNARKAKPHKYTPRIPNEVREQICREYIPNVRGHGRETLAKKFGVSKSTILSIIREGRPDYEITPHRIPDKTRDEIRRLYVYGSHEFGSYALAKKYGITSTAILKIVHEN